MSKMRTYGQQIQVFVSDDGVSYTKRLGEVMSVSYKSKNIVKEHSSLGETGIGSIDVLENGGTLSFELDKTDAQFPMFFASMDQHLRGGDRAGNRGKAPYFNIMFKTTFPDESTEDLVFEGVCLHDDEGSVSGRTEVFQEKFQGTYKKRFVGVAGADAIKASDDGITLLNTALNNLIVLSANTTAGYEETVNVKSYSPTGARL